MRELREAEETRQKQAEEAAQIEAAKRQAAMKNDQCRSHIDIVAAKPTLLLGNEDKKEQKETMVGEGKEEQNEEDNDEESSEPDEANNQDNDDPELDDAMDMAAGEDGEENAQFFI